MCGIFCTVTCASSEQMSYKTDESCEWSLCKDVIANRGPDSLHGIEEELTDEWHGQFYASILWMQGSKPISQPLVDNDCNVLLWNGDVFSGDMFKENSCDSENVLQALEDSMDVCATLYNIKGPFSFIYYQESSNLLYFGRDRLGRHSLLLKISEDCKSLLLTSVAVKSIENIIELPAIGIFIIDLNEEKLTLKCKPWYKPNERFFNRINDLKNQYNADIQIVESKYLPSLGDSFINIQPTPEMGFLKYIENIKKYKNFDEIMDYLLKEETIMQLVSQLEMLLNESVKRRVKTIPRFCRNCTNLNGTDQICQHVKIGILFSGGLDSAILAVLAHNNIDFDESIDLINVAFEKKGNSNYNVPDRKTGRKTYEELSKICPKRKFNFIEVDVPGEELEKYRSSRIANLVYPHATVLDDSLACAVWFASRAKNCSAKEPYESPCRVLLLGMGADEQFGGYMRHRTTLKRNGWIALSEELKLDFDRISERNLGRDDRMVADHGRQSRLPYLDEDLVEFIQKLPPWERCCPTENFPAGLGDKLLLRLLARKLQLTEASKFPKRAFQFGSRIADGKENAKDLSKRL